MIIIQWTLWSESFLPHQTERACHTFPPHHNEPSKPNLPGTAASGTASRCISLYKCALIGAPIIRMLWAYTLPPKYALDLRGSLVNAFEPSVDGEEMWRYATRLRLDMTSMGVREEREGQQREREICLYVSKYVIMYYLPTMLMSKLRVCGLWNIGIICLILANVYL